MSDCALELPFGGESDDERPTDGWAAAEVGHFLASATWAPAAKHDTGGGDDNEGGNSSAPSAMLHVETLVSSAAVRLQPEGFNLMEAVHIRTACVMPLVAGNMGCQFCMYRDGSPRGGGGGGTSFEGSRRDELVEKLREKRSSRDGDPAVLLPARPALRHEDGVAGGGGSGSVAERAQLLVTVSPVRFNVAEPHILDLTCFALDAATRLADVSELLFAPADSTTTVPTRNGGGNMVLAVAKEPEVGARGGAQTGEVPRPELPAEHLGSALEAAASASSAASATSAASAPSRAVGASTDAGDGNVTRRRAGWREPSSFSAAASSERAPEGSAVVGRADESVLPPERVVGYNSQPPQHYETGPAPSRNRDTSLFQASVEGQEVDDVLGEQELLVAQASGGQGGQQEVDPETAAARVSVPVPPAFLGTLVIDAVSVILLKADRSASADSSDRGGGGDTVTGNARLVGARLGERSASARGGSPLAAHSQRPSTFTRSQSCEPDTSVVATRCRYSPLILVEVRGVGVGIDLARTPPPPPATGSPEQPSLVAVSPVTVEEDSGGTNCQHRVELVIKGVALTDVSDRGQGSLVRLLSGAAAAAAGEESTVDGGRGCDDDGERVLPAGWWRRGGNEDDPPTRRCDEQVAVRARIDPVSRTASVNASVASGYLMLLPAPILDVLSVGASLTRGVARHARFRDAERGRSGGEERAGDGLRTERRTAECRPEQETVSVSARATPSTPSAADAYRSEPRMVRSDNNVGGVGLAGGRDNKPATTIPPALSLPWEVLAGRSDAAAERSNDGGFRDDLNAESRRGSWRQAVRALGGAALSDFLWLERVDVALSASDLQLWLPDVGETAANVDASYATTHHCGTLPPLGSCTGDEPVVQGFSEAIVAACDCHLAVSIAVSLLGADDAGDSNPVPAAGVATVREAGPSIVEGEFSAAGETNEGRGDRGATTAESMAGDGRQINVTTAASTATATAADPSYELCVIHVGVHALEVFVARPSMADFGAPTAEVPVVVLSPAMTATMDGEDAEDRSPEPVAAHSPSVSPSMEASLRGRVAETAEGHPSAASRGGGLASTGLGGRSSDGPAPLPVSLEDNAGGAEAEAPGQAGDGLGRVDGDVVGSGGRRGSRNTEAVILPFSADLKHVLRVHPSSWSPSMPVPPLSSEVNVSVTPIRVVWFLDFPLAGRVMANSLALLAGEEAIPGPAAEEQKARDRGGQPWGEEVAGEEGRDDGVRRGEGASAEATGGSAAEARAAGVSVVPRVAVASGEGWTGAAVGDGAMGATEAAPRVQAVWEELAAMWACRVGLEAAECRLTVVNNYYRQSMPSFKVNVRGRHFVFCPVPRACSFCTSFANVFFFFLFAGMYCSRWYSCSLVFACDVVQKKGFPFGRLFFTFETPR